MEINGANILVTGGCGMIGSATIDLILAEYAPARIVVLDNLVYGSIENLSEALKDPRVTLMCSDIRDANSVRRAAQGMDAVIHLAALNRDACRANTREAFDVMCEGSFNVVEGAHLAGVKRFVAASSASIYGLTEALPTSEQHHPYNDRTWYGSSKVMLEGLLRSYHAMFGFPYIALRYGDVYGPRMNTEGAYTDQLIEWMQSIAEGKQPVIPGDGTQTMDLIYIDDAARSNMVSLDTDVVDEVFNIASGVETSLRELADALNQAMGLRARPSYEPKVSAGGASRRLADISKAERVLGFKPRVGLPEGLARLVEWWEATIPEKAHS